MVLRITALHRKWSLETPWEPLDLLAGKGDPVSNKVERKDLEHTVHAFCVFTHTHTTIDNLTNTSIFYIFNTRFLTLA